MFSPLPYYRIRDERLQETFRFDHGRLSRVELNYHWRLDQARDVELERVILADGLLSIAAEVNDAKARCSCGSGDRDAVSYRSLRANRG
jgi:hypothetical protein